MANIQIHTIQFIANNPFGGFVAGDILDVYLDTDLASTAGGIDGITVNLNGSPLSESPQLISTDPSIVAIEDSSYNFCVGTYLITTKNITDWPYGAYDSLADHPSCAVAPVVCDLIVVGQPDVVNATGDTNTDGQITVVATSSNTIQYSLSPFSYGSGQASGVFANLIPGTYRIYLADDKNCKTEVLVEVGVTYNYGDRFILEYTDLKGFETKLLVTKKNYSGVLTEVCGAAIPFELKLKGNGSDNKFEPLLAVQGNLNLLSESDLQFLELYTNDPDLYRIEYYKDFGAGFIQYNTLKVLPQQYGEDYKFPPYYVSVASTDGLPELKNFFLIQKDGQRYHGTISLIKLIALILNPLKLELNIAVACNLYAAGMDTTDSDDPFDQAYVDFEAFYLQDDLPAFDAILSSILEPFGCRVVQWENRWNIVRVEELRTDFDYRLFDSTGEYLSNGTYEPLQSIGTDVIFAEANQFLEIRPGFGKIRVNYLLGLKPNILDNGDFRLKSTYNPDDGTYSYEVDKDGWTLSFADYPISENYQTIDTGIAYLISSGNEIITSEEGGEAYLLSKSYSISMGSNNQLKISIRLKAIGAYAAFAGKKYRSVLPYIKVRLEILYGSTYLQGDGTWGATSNEVIFYITAPDQFQTFEIIAVQPTTGTPATGQDFTLKMYHPFAYHAQFHGISALQAFVTANTIPDGYRTELRDDFTTSAYMYYYELEETTATASGYDVIQPTDYNATTNNRRWVKKNRVHLSGISEISIAIDYIKVQFLFNNELPFDTITRSINGEGGNIELLDKNIILGSSGDLVTSEVVTTSFSLNIHRIPPTVTTTEVTTSILSYQLIYAGFLRDSTGEGYELWTRDGYTESDKLHGIFLQMYAGQYKRSWRLLRGPIRNKNSFFGLLNTLSEAGFIYLPISLTLDDKKCTADGEFLELMDSNPASTSSGFTSGFNQIAFR